METIVQFQVWQLIVILFLAIFDGALVYHFMFNDCLRKG